MGFKVYIRIQPIMKTRSQTTVDEAVKGLLMLKHTPVTKPKTFTILATSPPVQRPRRAGVKY
jgi:hypothetical protein